MRKVLILSNHHAYTYNLRKEIIQRLLDNGYKVYLALPYGEKIEMLKAMGCEFIDISLDGRGVNPITDFKLFIGYFKIIGKIKPDLVLSYTIKPNIYGGFASRLLKIPYIVNITGLGSAVHNGSILQKIVIKLYRIALKKASCIFFQNNSDKQFFIKHRIGSGKYKVIPGSGVNLKIHCFEEYPSENNYIKFLFIGRIMKEKGIEEFIEAAKVIKEKYPEVEFEAIGLYGEDYESKIKELNQLGIINFLGVKDSVHEYIKNSNAVVLPSYHEGMANVLLEAAATGRPVIASNIPGCKETFDEGISGIGFQTKNSTALEKALIKFINLPYKQKKQMGLAGRKKMEEEFDRNIVVNAYINEINKILG